MISSMDIKEECKNVIKIIFEYYKKPLSMEEISNLLEGNYSAKVITDAVNELLKTGCAQKTSDQQKITDNKNKSQIPENLSLGDISSDIVIEIRLKELLMKKLNQVLKQPKNANKDLVDTKVKVIVDKLFS